MNCITTRTDTAERSEYTDLPFMAEAASYAQMEQISDH